MSRLNYYLIILFCFAVWILVAISFAYDLVGITSENILRVFVGSLITTFMIYKAKKLKKKE